MKDKLYTVSEVAEKLGIGGQRVRDLAQSRHLGRKLGSQWVFTEGEIEKMRTRIPGRPRKEG